jgi:hypothetical protein
MAEQVWRPLNSSARDGIVLAVDYPFTGRPEAGFGELVATLAPDHEVWESVPPTGGAETGMTGGDYVRWWLSGLDGRPVHAVLGFCAGSVYAAAIADRLATTGTRPEVVLFDPEAPSRITVYWQFHKVLDGLSVALEPDEVAEHQQRGRELAERTEDLAVLRDALLAVFLEAGAIAFARAGLDDVRRDEFAATVSAFMTYLVAAASLDPAEAWRQATAISSRTTTNGLNLVDPAAREGMVAQDIRFDVEHADLLRDPGVARTVAGLLARRGAGHSTARP